MAKLKLHHSLAEAEAAVGADGVETFDLPVNPLSIILICIRPLNDTGTLANFNRSMGLAGSLNNISVNYRGQTVYNSNGRDLLALNYYRHGMTPYEANPDDVNNERRCMVLPLLLGRHPYDWRSCFPASRRGEFTMSLDWDIADTGYDGMRRSIETVELLGAEPVEYERKAVINRTFGATGNNDVNLPIGYDCRGILGFSTTAFGGATPAPGLGNIQLMLDNQQTGYASIDFEVAHQLSQLFGRQPPGEAHVHEMEPVAGVRTTHPKEYGAGGEGWENYCWLDTDPMRDDTYSIATAGANNFIARVNAETAEAVRLLPIERVTL